MNREPRTKNPRPAPRASPLRALRVLRAKSTFHLPPSTLPRAPRAAFTLIEMLAVILIICLLASAGIGAYQHARTVAWKAKARDTARQLVLAWNTRLTDDQRFPNPPVPPGPDVDILTTPSNMAALNNNNRTYFEQNAEQKANGLCDKWSRPGDPHYFHVRLDANYDGLLSHPTNRTAADHAIIHASVAVWSDGARTNVLTEKIVVW